MVNQTNDITTTQLLMVFLGGCFTHFVADKTSFALQMYIDLHWSTLGFPMYSISFNMPYSKGLHVQLLFTF